MSAVSPGGSVNNKFLRARISENLSTPTLLAFGAPGLISLSTGLKHLEFASRHFHFAGIRSLGQFSFRSAEDDGVAGVAVCVECGTTWLTTAQDVQL